jgi:hypothetical protein
MRGSPPLALLISYDFGSPPVRMGGDTSLRPSPDSTPIPSFGRVLRRTGLARPNTGLWRGGSFYKSGTESEGRTVMEYAGVADQCAEEFTAVAGLFAVNRATP